MIKEIRMTVENPKLEPTRNFSTDAGFDLKSKIPSFKLDPGQTVKVATGVRLEIPRGYAGFVLPRSGWGTKYQVKLANTVGLIDPDYRGEVMVFLTNGGTESIKVEQYDRFAQLVIMPIFSGNLLAVQQISTTERDSAGFGSSGVK